MKIISILRHVLVHSLFTVALLTLPAVAGAAVGEKSWQLVPDTETPFESQMNLLRGKAVFSTKFWSDKGPKFAVDGDSKTLAGYWNGVPLPAMLTVDMGAPEVVNGAKIVFYWQGTRKYQFMIEGSLDGNAWTLLVDERQSSQQATAAGFTYQFKKQSIRYLRTTVTGAVVAKSGAHILEVEAYGDKMAPEELLRSQRREFREAIPSLSRYTNEDGFDLYKLRTMIDQLPKEKKLAARLDGAEAQVVSLSKTHFSGKAIAPAAAKSMSETLDALATDISTAYGWPYFRGNVGRNPVSFAQLPKNPTQRWVHKAALPPAPAWHEPATVNHSAGSAPLTATLTFDRVYHTTLQGGRLYYGSSADDSVHCLDADTGKETWTFATEGPVRLAPAIYDGKVFAVSDDGFFYCLDAIKGTLLWKHRAAPKDSRLPGNGRIISNCPVRSGIGIADGIVYFAAGIFPKQGAYLCALRADSGEVVWKHKIGNSPQGYLSLSPSRIFVPTGRTPFVTFNRETGKSAGSLGVSNSWGKRLKGGSYAVVVNNQVTTGPSEDGHMDLFGAPKRESLLRTPGIQVIEAGKTIYVLEKNHLTAMQRSSYLVKRKPVEIWTMRCPGALTMLATNNAIVVGQKDHVSVFDRKSGKALWQQEIEGRAEGLSLSGSCLYVSTDKGDIYCFGKSGSSSGLAGQAKPAEGKVPAGAGEGIPRDEFSVQMAEMLVEKSGFAQGYCLVLDAGDGRLCAEIAAKSKLRVIGVERDPAKVVAARTMLRAANLYGNRVVIHQSLDKVLPYRHYLFNIITSARHGAGALPSYEPAEIFRVLRPDGGFLALSLKASTTSREGLASFGKVMPGWKVTNTGRFLTGSAHRAAVKGAGEWTHPFGDAGNTACSQDNMEFQAMATQWYGRPGPRYMNDRHLKGTPPIYAKGHLFVGGKDYVGALDAYNGTILWEHFIENSGRVAVSRDCGQLAATDKHLYVAHGASCSAFAARTGEESFRMDLAEGKEWDYLAVVGDAIIGSEAEQGTSFRAKQAAASRENHLALYWKVSFKGDGPFACSRRIFVRNISDGSERWSYVSPGVIINPTIACVGGQVVFVESLDEAAGSLGMRIDPKKLLAGGKTRVTAVNMKSGKVVWQTPVDLTKAQWSLYMVASESRVVVASSRYAQIDGKIRNRYDMQAFDTKSGKPVWQSTDKPSHDTVTGGGHGELNQHPAIVENVIYNTGFARYLDSGKAYEGWKWTKSGKCGIVSMSGRCAFSRSGNPYMYDLKTGKRSSLTAVSRPGCWINTLAVGGMVLIPDASAGCTCGYSIQTTLALSPSE